ncbi:MAG: helix-turn-helix domain-containing protein [Pseudonocardiaceae bacterium]
MIPPEALVVMIPGDVARTLLDRAGLDEFRRVHRGEDRRLDECLAELTRVAHRWDNLLTEYGQKLAAAADTGASSPLTTTQAAQRARVSPRTITRAITAGHLPATRVGRAYLVSRADIDAYTRRTG